MSKTRGGAVAPWCCALTLLIHSAAGLGAQAQPLGTFRWQLQPFCNVLTLSVRQDGTVYTLDGTDDQCGAAQRSGVVGAAFLNPDGSLGFSLSSLTAPGAAPVVLHARVSLATVSGTWSDSAGNGGTFLFTQSPSAGGSPRPVPANGIRPGSITAGQLAPGAVGAAQIAPGAITAAQIALGAITSTHIASGAITTAQLADGAITAGKIAPGVLPAPVAGSCPAGHYLRGILANGAVACEPLSAPPTTLVVDDIADQVGAVAAMVLRADGRPVIVHHSNTAQFLRLTRCGDRFCTAGNVSQFISGAAPGNYRPSIAIGLNGHPVIAHFDEAASALRVTACGDADCDTWSSVLADDPATREVGRQTSIVVPPDGRPLISYHDTTVNRLRVTKCGTPSCSAGNVSTTLDAGTFSEGMTALAIGADGRPIVARSGFTFLRVTKCGNDACTAGNVSTTVDTAGFQIGITPSLVIGAGGRPLIAHRSSDVSVNTLRLTVCGDGACAAGNVTRVLDAVSSVGLGLSMALGSDGFPVVSHVKQDSGEVRVTSCASTDCSAGVVTVPVAGSAGTFGRLTSIGIGVDGLPIIAFGDSANDLRVTRCGSPGCR